MSYSRVFVCTRAYRRHAAGATSKTAMFWTQWCQV